MKQILRSFLLVLTASLMFTSNSFADWTMISKNETGQTFYLDFERVRKHDGFVYFWYLLDYGKTSTSEILSGKTYALGDCNLFRYKWLDVYYYSQKMGRGTPYMTGIPQANQNKWHSAVPESSMENVLNAVCAFAEQVIQ